MVTTRSSLLIPGMRDEPPRRTSIVSDARATTASDQQMSWSDFTPGKDKPYASTDLPIHTDLFEECVPVPRAVQRIIKELPPVLHGRIQVRRRKYSVFEDYEKLKEIGSGTYAKVYKLRHKTTDCITAGKVLKPHRFPINTEKRVVQMFINEISLLARTQCPGTVQLNSVVWAPDGVLLDLEFVDGGTVWKEKVCPTTESRWRHLLQLMQAVQYIHSCGVVHRDLKPTNILRCSSSVLKIADFGWAEEAQHLRLANGEWPGTLEINPPEVLNFTGPLTERIDNYAVGMNFLLFVSNRFVCRQKGLEVAHAVPVILKMVENLRRSHKPPPNFTEETWEIFLGLTDPDPMKRWTLSQVSHHPWIVRHYLQYSQDETLRKKVAMTLWFEPTRRLLESYSIPTCIGALTPTRSAGVGSSFPQSPSKSGRSLLHRVLHAPRSLFDWADSPASRHSAGEARARLQSCEKEQYPNASVPILGAAVSP